MPSIQISFDEAPDVVGAVISYECGNATCNHAPALIAMSFPSDMPIPFMLDMVLATASRCASHLVEPKENLSIEAVGNARYVDLFNAWMRSLIERSGSDVQILTVPSIPTTAH